MIRFTAFDVEMLREGHIKAEVTPHPDVDANATLATVSGDLMITRKSLKEARATIKLLVAALVTVGLINGAVMASIIWGR